MRLLRDRLKDTGWKASTLWYVAGVIVAALLWLNMGELPWN